MKLKSKELRRKLTRIEALLLRVHYVEKQIMAKLDDVKAEIASLKDHVTTETAEVSAKVKDLGDQLQALKDQIASGSGATEQDMQDVIDQLKGVETQIDDIVPSAPVVVPPPVEPAV